ncbi:hypothetical protein [Vibrio phage D4]|nr:hypothetical protein [Vibrio phage D4]
MTITVLQTSALNAILNANSATQTAADANFIKALAPKEAEDLQQAAKLIMCVKESVWQRVTAATEVAPTEGVKVETRGRRATSEELEDAVDDRRAKTYNKPEAMVKLKQFNEHRPVGSKINCPACSKQITKARYNTNFCSNKGAGNCKDAFYQATQGDRHKKG